MPESTLASELINLAYLCIAIITLETLLTWLNCEHMGEYEESSEPSAGHQNPAQNIVPSPVNSKNHRGNRAREKKPTDCFDRTLRIVGLVIALIVALIYYRQLNAMRHQQGIMQQQLAEAQSEQRAWVSLAADPVITEPLTLDTVNNLIRTTVKFLVKNTGKNPAIDTAIVPEAAPYKMADKDWMTAVCNYATPSLKGPWNMGISVFPGDQHFLTYVISIKRDDIVKATKGIPGAEKIMWATVVACIVYVDAVTHQLHHTPYVFRLVDISPSVGHGGAIFLDELPIDSKKIGLAEEGLTFIPPD